MALRMYANGACKTLSEAADLCDVSLAYLSMVKNAPIGDAYMNESQRILDEKAANWSQCINALGRRAVAIIADKMEDDANPKLQLQAAIDIADRAPETSKVQKMQIESFTLGEKSAKDIAAALVAASRVEQTYAHLASGNHDCVTPALDPSMEIPANVKTTGNSAS